MSCVHAVANITEYFRTVIANQTTGQDSLIDLGKTSDTLNHAVLLVKIESKTTKLPKQSQKT